MRRVFQAVAPVEAMPPHDPHHHAPSGRKAAPAPGSHTAQIHRQPGLMHGGSGPFSAVDPAPGAATAAAGAPIDGALLGSRSECAVNLRPKTSSTHLAHGRVEPRAGVIIKRIYSTARQRPQT